MHERTLKDQICLLALFLSTLFKFCQILPPQIKAHKRKQKNSNPKEALEQSAKPLVDFRVPGCQVWKGHFFHFSSETGFAVERPSQAHSLILLSFSCL